MITPKLEELILCGKAFFKSAVVGGSKSTINIENDRFIIITDITFLPYYNTDERDDTTGRNCNTQLSIYGERGFNHYIFANHRFYQPVTYDPTTADTRYVSAKMPLGAQTINCYLLHTTQVGFSFLVNAGLLPNVNTAVASFDNPGYQPPLDYGIDGMPGAVPTDYSVTPANLINYVVNRGTLPVGIGISQQIQFAASAATLPVVLDNPQFPIANINYIEILGQPNNIGI
jgi:hypothetical protein